ncbi:sugar ABC transporter substrate-binding protein [Actinoplanes sp. OR16]|uniref:ABC transporter substrate-binding protein n=1 Tax=Actinoplanes sp. OR16 TaxID=946334 RepID=UPI000F6BBD17|nr:extracellular solute-binding protein [Actinoplanes sp. OR16]BBH68467.1 sugar ABC transporter substrate-binding protein [Actinoplanes sp. OR16]
MRRGLISVLAAGTVTVLLAGCLSDGGGPPESANTSRGPIEVWLSTNPEEVAWGEDVVAGWNAEHPDQKVTAQQIPAGKTSEEVIYASIVAGNAPCVVMNTAPSAVPQFQKAGGLVPLDTFPDGDSYVEARTGASVADQYRSPDGRFYQIPWKVNPVMIFYNKKLFAQAGIDTVNPPLTTWDQFLQTSRTLVRKGVAHAAIWPAPSSEFFQSWFDYYPLAAARTRQQLVEDGAATFDSADGIAVGNFWRTLYAEKLAPQEKYNGDSFADGQAAMAIVGPWAISVYKDDIDWGAVPIPTEDGKPADQIYTFSDEKSLAVYFACENRLTAWDFVKYATSEDADGRLLELTGQMPMRQNLPATYASYFAGHPDYEQFAGQAGRIVEVPNVPNSTEIWQTFRNAWTASVVFADKPIDEAFADAAARADELLTEE